MGGTKGQHSIFLYGNHNNLLVYALCYIKEYRILYSLVIYKKWNGRLGLINKLHWRMELVVTLYTLIF